MGLVQKIKNGIKFTDFFYCTEMLRFDNQNQFKTMTGGLISIGIIITITIGFANMIMDTLQLNTITFTLQTQKSIDPQYAQLSTAKENYFMFGLEIWNLNLSSTNQYFDVSTIAVTTENGIDSNLTKIPLQTCTPEHWSDFPEIASSYYKLNMGNWLCPPIGTNYNLQGKYSSELYYQLLISVSKCNATGLNNSCVSQEELEGYFAENRQQIYFTIYHTNVVINADQKEYKKYYLEDQNFVIFGSQTGSETHLLFANYQVVTDESIWPFTSTAVESGLITVQKAFNHPYQVGQNFPYVQLYIQKSPNNYVYNRQAQKISAVFSFIGGLIGAVSAGLFIFKIYTSLSYEISIAMQIFYTQKNFEVKDSQSKTQEEDQKVKWSFNFFEFLKFSICKLAKLVGINIESNQISYMFECHRQILKQLDIKSIVNRIIFLEFAITHLLQDYQLEGIQLKKPTRPHEVKRLRQKCDLYDQINEEASECTLKHTRESMIPLPAIKDNLNKNFNIEQIFEQGWTNLKLNEDLPTGTQNLDTLKKKQCRLSIQHKPNSNNLNMRQDMIVESIDGQSESSQKSSQIIKQTEKKLKQINQNKVNRMSQLNKRISLLKDLQQSAYKGDRLSKRICENFPKISFRTKLTVMPQ